LIQANSHSNSKKLQFSLLNAQDTVRISEFEVTHRELYTPTDRLPVKHGVLDRRLVGTGIFVLVFTASRGFQGTTDKSAFCETCGLNPVKCVGHYAYIKLVVPVFHIGYFKHTIAVLQVICKVRSALVGLLTQSLFILLFRRRAHVFSWMKTIGGNI
jgi:DNA-directed RNA polymerase III subunit RPC1